MSKRIQARLSRSEIQAREKKIASEHEQLNERNVRAGRGLTGVAAAHDDDRIARIGVRVKERLGHLCLCLFLSYVFRFF
jgi:hypothetical protein